MARVNIVMVYATILMLGILPITCDAQISDLDLDFLKGMFHKKETTAPAAPQTKPLEVQTYHIRKTKSKACVSIRIPCETAALNYITTKGSYDLTRDCETPIMQGLAHGPDPSKPLPTIPKETIEACRQEDPGFGK